MGSSSLSSAPVVKDVDVPAEERCVVGWVQVATEDHRQPTEGGGTRSDTGVLEWQLIALTYLGGWYRLALPTRGKDKRRESGGAGGSASGGSASGSSRESVGIVAGGLGRRVSGHGGIGPSPLGPGGLGSVAYGSPPKAMSRRGSAASTFRGADKGKEKDREKEKESRDCVLLEFRRFGRWDGWG